MNDNLRLDSRYLDWLCDQVGAIPDRTNAESSYILLCEQMFQTRFEDWLPNDDNRASDGMALRDEFLDTFKLYSGSRWISEDCSILEMLIALSRRVADIVNLQPSRCFWLLVTNLELDKYTDAHYSAGAVEFALKMLNNRTYERDGRGGLFPLDNSNDDQREIEIWYQMSIYILEKFGI